MRKDLSKHENVLFQEVSDMIESMQPLISQNILILANHVDVIINSHERDDNRIQRLLDSVLDYAGMCDEGFILFKRLCRYYYGINPQVTAEYISIYRDLYDS
ncbi:MAG: hypothetical protein FIA99_15675 [Ruminiclostridium sp.]|nr:hypothetical protein [Ruminiclostridium sp.]